MKRSDVPSGPKRCDAPQRIAAGGLDLEHLGPEVGQDPARHGRRLAGQIGDADPGNSAWRCVAPSPVPVSVGTPQEAAVSRTCTAQAEPRPMTWVRPTWAPSIWRSPASPRRWVATS